MQCLDKGTCILLTSELKQDDLPQYWQHRSRFPLPGTVLLINDSKLIDVYLFYPFFIVIHDGFLVANIARGRVPSRIIIKML